MPNAQSLLIRALRERLNSRLNDYLCDMRPDYDDSITGFNEAWDLMRKVFDEELKRLEASPTP